MNKKKQTIYFILIITLLITFIIYLNKNKKREIEEKGKYTIAVTKGSQAVEFGGDVNYEYNIKNKTYNKWSHILNNRIKIKKGRYFLLYLPSDPEEHIILQDKPVPDNILIAPPNGWSKEEFEKMFGKEIEN